MKYPLLDNVTFWVNVISWIAQGGLVLYFVGGKARRWYKDYKMSVEEEELFQKEVN